MRDIKPKTLDDLNRRAAELVEQGVGDKYKPTNYDYGRHKAEMDYVHYLVETRRRFGKK